MRKAMALNSCVRVKTGAPVTRFLLAGLLCISTGLWGQEKPVQGRAHGGRSLGDSVRAGNTQLHILYVHGIGADGPTDYNSQALRKSICRLLRDCTTPQGEMMGTEYADESVFTLNAPPPKMSYMGEPVWKVDTPDEKGGSGRSEEWNASAPYVDHWKLQRTHGAQPIYVDEINWWPLVFALKCGQIVASDAALIGPNKSYLRLCSQSIPDPHTPGRFRLYPWIPAAEAQRLAQLPARGALVNRGLKDNLLDWGFSDAVLAVGRMQPLLLNGIRQLVLKSVNVSPDGSRGGVVGPQPNQEFVIVSHSLGSYLIFAALDLAPDDTNAPEPKEWKKHFETILGQTSSVYFFANQLRLLELADLDPNGAMISHLATWGRLRHSYLQSQSALQGQGLGAPTITAWNDPSDLLTWEVPAPRTSSGDNAVVVNNCSVKNASHWFWLFAGPTSAHDNYSVNKQVIGVMLDPEHGCRTR
jgi:hypothetical protein